MRIDVRGKKGEVLFAWPLREHVLTAGYYYSGGGLHRAVDMRAGVGTPVYAAEDGVVESVQLWNGKSRTGMQSYGNMVLLRHEPYRGRVLKTRYAHLRNLCVRPGQTVAEGQMIGYSGASGNCYGAHLHFEVIWAGTRYNPLCWLDDDFVIADRGVFTYQKGEHAVPTHCERRANHED